MVEVGRDGDAVGDMGGWGETRHGGLLSHEMESPLVVGSVSRLREGRS